ncbi:MAG: hypothetical protein JWM76_2890, partial [Pseudonocardiales bacterium]|nr:hypothetical protein [Pseudonocardiales bacterium]
MYAGGFDIRRVTYQVGGWNLSPSRMRISGRDVQLTGSASQASATVSLINRSGRNCLDLLVIPPATPTAAAQHCLT